METASLNLGDPEAYTDGVPYDVFARLRRETPVAWIDEPARPERNLAAGPGFWAVTRHADVDAVSRDQATFSSWLGTTFLRDPRPQEVPLLRQMMLNMDPPEHTNLRRIISRVFTPRAVAELMGSIEGYAKAIVDAVAEKGEVDFVEEIAAEMPLLVLADVLGVPGEDRHLLFDWTNRLIGYDDPEFGGDDAGFRSAFTDMFAYAAEKTKEKRAKPGEDVWSRIVNAEVDGQQLSRTELERFFQLLVVAGNETTRNHLTGALYALSLHRTDWDRLRGDLSLMPGALDEVLRWWPPVIQFRRTATKDTELAGQPIAEGDKVVIFYASANRDEATFSDPDRFDITRDPNPHLSFGVGPHFCLGAALAKLEAKVLLTELFARLPDLEVAGPPERLRSNFINGIRHLPVRFTPQKVSG
jgi:cytochrome P450/NADPH-cytochrome P450 reductase